MIDYSSSFSNINENARQCLTFNDDQHVKQSFMIKNKYYQLCDILANSSITDKIYLPDIIVSGYTGHVPTMQEKFGKNLKDLFLEAIVDFEDGQTYERYINLDFKLQKLLEEGSITKQDLPRDSRV